MFFLSRKTFNFLFFTLFFTSLNIFFLDSSLANGLSRCQKILLPHSEDLFNLQRQDIFLDIKSLARFRIDIDQKKNSKKSFLLINSLDNNFQQKLGELISKAQKSGFILSENEIKALVRNEVQKLDKETPLEKELNVDSEPNQKKILDEGILFHTETFNESSFLNETNGEVKSSGTSTISSDGKYLFVDNKADFRINKTTTEVFVIDVEINQVVGSIYHKNPEPSFLPYLFQHEVHLSPDKKKIIIFGFQYIDLYSLESKAFIKRFKIDDAPDQFFFSPDGRYAFSGALNSSTLKIIDLSNDNLLREEIDYKGSWGPLLFTKDGKYLITSTVDHEVKAIQLGSWTSEYSSKFISEVPNSFLMMDEHFLVTVSEDFVKITEIGTWKNITLDKAPGGKLVTILKSNDSHRLYVKTKLSENLLLLDVEEIIQLNRSSFSGNNIISSAYNSYPNNFLIPVFSSINSGVNTASNPQSLWKVLSTKSDPNDEAFFTFKSNNKMARKINLKETKIDIILSSHKDDKTKDNLVQFIEPQSGEVLQSFSFNTNPLIKPSYYKIYFPITAFTSKNGKYLFVTDGLFFKVFDTSYFILLYEFDSGFDLSRYEIVNDDLLVTQSKPLPFVGLTGQKEPIIKITRLPNVSN